MISDTFNICIEEIALSGLEGAPLQLLWIRLEDRINSKVIPDTYKQSIWEEMVKLSSKEKGCMIAFYTTPKPVLVNNVFYDSYWQSDVIANKQRLYIPPPNSWKMNKDDKLDVWGCCEHYKERIDITKSITDSNITFTAAVHKYGDNLVLVANQNIREHKLTGPMTDPAWMRSSPKHYSVIETVGKI
ncbi:General transcription factor IIIC, polypeptide 1, alpha [Oopsacas minuta]|uniref:General transcription factor IIIC, polypeptide 1, alpha n=1 Tax=Oopsacas minuta TaxID=111878 RepID=A0AAV7KI49_9METZ|nr:General transcription factor IIIC, polypeptide 1, alpha [Oopsacas minuta]